MLHFYYVHTIRACNMTLALSPPHSGTHSFLRRVRFLRRRPNCERPPLVDHIVAVVIVIVASHCTFMCTELGEIADPRLRELTPPSRPEGVRRRNSRNLWPTLSPASVDEASGPRSPPASSAAAPFSFRISAAGLGSLSPSLDRPSYSLLSLARAFHLSPSLMQLCKERRKRERGSLSIGAQVLYCTNCEAAAAGRESRVTGERRREAVD